MTDDIDQPDEEPNRGRDPTALRTRGRPGHLVTEPGRECVAIMRALNMATGEIAAAMGISETALRKNYAVELKHGLARKRAELLMRLWDEVEAGKISAIREFQRLIDKSDLRTPAATRPAKRTPKLGKKEQAVIDAATPDLGTSLGELMARHKSESSLH